MHAASVIIAGVVGAYAGGIVALLVGADYFLDLASRSAVIVAACRVVVAT
jgi:hypothetical protein